MANTLPAIVDRHLTQATAAHLIADIKALQPLGGDKTALLREIDRQMTEVDREQYGMAKSDAPRGAAFMTRFNDLDCRFRGLARLEREIKAAL